jgi:hypothetical protein
MQGRPHRRLFREFHASASTIAVPPECVSGYINIV